MKTTSKAQTAQLRTCKLRDSNGFIISACLLHFGHLFIKDCEWGHCQLVAFCAKERRQEFCQNFAALLHSVQKMMRKWRGFSDYKSEIHPFPKGHWTEGGSSVAFIKEKGSIWQQEEEEGREVAECHPGSALRPASNALEWHEVPNSCFLSMVTLHRGGRKQTPLGMDPDAKSRNSPGTIFWHFASPLGRCDPLSRSTDSFQIFFWPVG